MAKENNRRRRQARFEENVLRSGTVFEKANTEHSKSRQCESMGIHSHNYYKIDRSISFFFSFSFFLFIVMCLLKHFASRKCGRFTDALNLITLELKGLSRTHMSHTHTYVYLLSNEKYRQKKKMKEKKKFCPDVDFSALTDMLHFTD